MPNMSLNKVVMPEQDPKVRARNFEEVTLGYTEEMAVEEAERCLNCKNKPCVTGCPVGVKIPEFIAKVKEKDFYGAYEVIKSTNALPAVSGGVYPDKYVYGSAKRDKTLFPCTYPTNPATPGYRRVKA